MVFRFNCFEFFALATGFEDRYSNQTQIKSVYYSADPDFPEKRNLLKIFTYLELNEATYNFSPSSKIGDWEFGSVHKAVFEYQELLVKRIHEKYVKGYEKWVKEVNVLGLIRHPNLVKLVGFCAEDNETGRQRLLVYDYSYNHNLTRSIEDHLFTSVGIPLSWIMRLKVAKDVADGLAHLHEGTENQVIFGDFKSSNVLLDKFSRVKLSDYGLALLVPQKNLTHESTAVVGTTGYATPEYIHTGHQTSESDVWSFGVFLYELITGRRSLDINRPKDEQKLLEWVKPYVTSKNLQLIIDSRLDGNYSLESAQNLSIIANMCLSRNPKLRPKMSEVKNMVWQLFDASTLIHLSGIQKILVDFVEDTDKKDESGFTNIQPTESACLPARPSKLLKSCFGKIYCCD